jgi:hypothetical protein
MRGLRDSLTSDPRDKVYTGLEMISDKKGQQCDSTPNYASINTMADVHYAANKAIVTVYDSVDILNEAYGADAKIAS